MSEFNLSEKMVYVGGINGNCFERKDVKEFIKIIENEATKPNLTMGERIKIIRKHAGEELSK